MDTSLGKQKDGCLLTSDIVSLLKNPNLKLTEMRVLAHLLERLNGQSYLAISVAAMAKELSQDRSRVSLAMARLQEAGAIEAGPKIGRSYTYRKKL